MNRITLVGLVVLLSSLATSAQEHPNFAKGVAAHKNHMFMEGDAVDLFNGNLAIAIPLGLRNPVNGALSYGIVLYYNARPWVRGSTGLTPSDPERSHPRWKASIRP